MHFSLSGNFSCFFLPVSRKALDSQNILSHPLCTKKLISGPFIQCQRGAIYSAYSASSEHRTRQNSNSSTVQPNILFFVFLHFLKFAAWKYRPQYTLYTVQCTVQCTVYTVQCTVQLIVRYTNCCS